MACAVREPYWHRRRRLSRKVAGPLVLSRRRQFAFNRPGNLISVQVMQPVGHAGWIEGFRNWTRERFRGIIEICAN